MLWQRFFARYLDVTLYHAFWVTLLPLLGYNLFRNRNGGAMLVQVLSLLTMFFLEPLLLHIFAATPGKWLFGLRVTDGDDGKLTYEAALNRTAFVFWYGIRLDLPVLRLVRLYKCAEDEQGRRFRGKRIPSRLCVTAMAGALLLPRFWPLPSWPVPFSACCCRLGPSIAAI